MAARRVCPSDKIVCVCVDDSMLHTAGPEVWMVMRQTKAWSSLCVMSTSGQLESLIVRFCHSQGGNNVLTQVKSLRGV